MEDFVTFIKNTDETELKREDVYPDVWNRHIVDFLIEDYDEYSDGRVATSSVVGDGSGCVNEATIHAPTNVESYALKQRGTTEEIVDGIEVNVIDNVLHVYIKEGVPVSDAKKAVQRIISDDNGTTLERVKHADFEGR